MNSTSTTTYEMSKTYQYRKVMKPMLERKRRARINKCLDDLKDLIAECMQQQNGDANVKLEKADILELTVQHLRKIKKVKSTPIADGKESFRTGYIQAANEVSRCLASLPKIDIALGTQLMTHLGVRLNQLVAGPQITVTKVNAPLNVYCGGEISYPHQSLTMLSPVSSGYGSDSEYSTTSSSSSSSSSSATGLLMKVGPVPVVESGSPVWRPW